MPRSRQVLLASASALALMLSVPKADAADLVTKAPPAQTPPAPTVRSPWTWWLEGGAQFVGGDPYVPGLTPPFDARPSHVGATGALGVSYRSSELLIVDFDFRFGANRSTSNTFQFACLGTSACFTPISGPNSATRSEYNWVSDIMIGREIGLGGGTAQLEAGLRIAEIRGTTNGTMLMASGAPPFTSTDVYSQKNYFFGAGPRAAVDGIIPLGGLWSFQYMIGVAGLIGHRSSNQVATFTQTGGQTCFSGCALNVSTSDDTIVFNPDALLGIVYAVTPTMSVSVNVRADAYFAAFRAFNATGGTVNVDRIYFGPNLRVTWLFGP